MPEGDSALQLSQRMQWMVGRTVTYSSVRVPRYATASVTGERVRRVWPYGKYLFMQFGEQIVQTHLKMEGEWSVHRVGARWPRPGHMARIVLRFTPQRAGGSEIEAVGFRLGLVRVFPATEYDATVSHLGPDILDPQWDQRVDEVVARIMQRPDRSVGAALLDQRNVAGIGNEYRAEVMFLVGRHPGVRVASVGRAGIREVLNVSRAVMWENRWERYRVFTGDKRPGKGNFVFGRAGQPCVRCGATIQEGRLGGRWAGGDAQLDEGELERIIWWCPRCQPN